MTTYLTEDLKRKLAADVAFIDDQFELIRKALDDGDHEEAVDILDGLYGLWDFKDDFPDLPLDAEHVIRFRDLYDLFAALNWATGDVLDATSPQQPGRSLKRELEELRWLLQRLRRLRSLSFSPRDEAPGLIDRLIEYFVRLIALLEVFPDPPTEEAQTAFFEKWNALGSLDEMKQALFALFSDPLPLGQIYLSLWWLDTDMRDALRRARTEKNLAWLHERLDCWIRSKHGILAAIDATRAQTPPARPPLVEDPDWFTAPPGSPLPRPEGWDDLFPWPPPSYGFIDGKLLPVKSRRKALGLFEDGAVAVGLEVPRGGLDRERSLPLLSLWPWLLFAVGIVVGLLLGKA